MELTEEQIQALKQKQLEIFKAFITSCEQLGLKYYVLGGTMLGAVRHKGYIPWDDDIDIGMLRKDYDIFLKLGQSCLPEKYFLQTHVTDPEYPQNFAKIRDSSTTFVEKAMKNLTINHGVFIDIFPLDYYPDKHQICHEIMHLLQRLRISDAFTLEKPSLRARFVRLFSRILYPTIVSAVHAREKLMNNTQHSSKIANYCGAWGRKEIVPCEWYGEGTMITFEGMQVRLPTNYHGWLTQVYGNYMQFPPPEKRIPHHYVASFDLQTSYIIKTKEKL